MKKILISAALMCCVGAASALAASGDVAGQYYGTDIKTYLNGYEINSINIGGATLIKAEDMQYYSFEVYWDADGRRLDISRSPHPSRGAVPEVVKEDVPLGEAVGDYYETDIKTYLGGKETISYNTGGVTYISAEQMRDFGYEVIWSNDDRTLKITSPDRAGREYGIFLSKGKKPESVSDAGYNDCCAGAFSLIYKDGAVTGAGDASLFNANLGCDGIAYTVNMSFYQNEGLFYSETLQNKLRELSYHRRGEQLAEPEEKYDLINKDMTIKINGQTASRVTVTEGGGNGHIDFVFRIYDLPIYKEQEIGEIEFSMGDTSGMEAYAVTKPSYSDVDSHDAAVASLIKSGEDYEMTAYTADDYFAVHMRESISWGVYRDRLYIVNRETGEISGDMLEQVRSVTGFDYDILNPFSIKTGDIKSNLFFSCAVEYKTGDFYADTNEGRVYMISSSRRNLPELVPMGEDSKWVIYKEGYRNNRVELAVFKTNDAALKWDGKILGADSYTDDVKYYADGDAWVEFERGYERVSNNAAEIIDGNIEILKY